MSRNLSACERIQLAARGLWWLDAKPDNSTHAFSREAIPLNRVNITQHPSPHWMFKAGFMDVHGGLKPHWMFKAGFMDVHGRLKPQWMF